MAPSRRSRHAQGEAGHGDDGGGDEDGGEDGDGGEDDGPWIWADLREDKMIGPAPGFGPIFGPLEPTAGPGSLGTGSGSKNSAGCAKKSAPETNYESRSWLFCVFGAGRKKMKR